MDLLAKVGPKLGIPSCCYTLDNKRRRNTLTNEDIAFAIKKSFYRVIPIIGGERLYRLMIFRLEITGMYITEGITFEINIRDKECICCNGLIYDNWHSFISIIPNMRFIIPSPADRVDQALKYYKNERRKEKKIQRKRMISAIDDYFCK